MGYVIEPRVISCVYRNYPYVGDGWIARWFVFDDKTGALLANNNGKGYATYQKAYWAYQWNLKGPPSIKVKQEEQEFIYAWSLKNKIIVDRVDRMSMTHDQEGTKMTPRHIKMLFDSQRATCPLDEEKFLLAYENNFYKEEIAERKKKQKKRAKIKKALNIKQKIHNYAEKSNTINSIVNTSDKIAVLMAPVSQYLHDLGKTYEDRPVSESSLEQARRMKCVSEVRVVSTDRPYAGHEWEIVPIDPHINPLYDTFGQEDPSQIKRTMPRESNPGLTYISSLEAVVDPISYQIVPKRTTRCTNAKEWTQMAGPPKKKKERPVVEPAAPLSTAEWVGLPEENTPLKTMPQVSPRKPKVEPSEARETVQLGKNNSSQKKKKRKPTPSKESQSFSDKLRVKMQTLKEEWSYEDDESEDDTYELPTLQDITKQMKEKVSNFFSDVKKEADKQKAEELAQREYKKQEKLAKKTASHLSNTEDAQEIQDTLADDVLPDLLSDSENVNYPIDDESVDKIIDEILQESVVKNDS